MPFTIGTCSNCGGAVQITQGHERVKSDIPDVPTCTKCGAISRNAYGPRIDMNPTPDKQNKADHIYREEWKKVLLNNRTY